MHYRTFLLCGEKGVPLIVGENDPTDFYIDSELFGPSDVQIRRIDHENQRQNRPPQRRRHYPGDNGTAQLPGQTLWPKVMEFAGSSSGFVWMILFAWKPYRNDRRSGRDFPAYTVESGQSASVQDSIMGLNTDENGE